MVPIPRGSRAMTGRDAHGRGPGRSLPLALLAFLLLLLGSTAALGSVNEVLADFHRNNTVISECHSLEDYKAARHEAPEQTYGDIDGAIDAALTDPSLVGTTERPCPERPADEDGGGGIWDGGTLLVVIALQIAVLGAALWLARHRIGPTARRVGRALSVRTWIVIGVLALGAGILVGGLAMRAPPAPTVEVVDTPVHAPVAAMQDDRLVPTTERSPAFIRARITRMAALGARTVRVDMRWDLVAASRPVNPGDPADPAYDWTTYDRIVAEAARAGIQVFFTVWGTPDWAADPGVPATASDPEWGNRRPVDSGEFGSFATAAVTRYSSRGVRSWEVWNEPNNASFLRPQYEREGSEWVAVGPSTYASLLAAFAQAAKAIDPDVVIVSGGVAPVGDPCLLRCAGTARMPNRLGPGQFLQALSELPEHTWVDVVAAHPYPSAPPPADGAPARTRKIDIDNLADLGTALAGTTFAGTPVWLTEYGWQTESTPSLTYAVTPDEQAARIADTFGLLTRFPAIELASYYFLQDNAAFTSGLYRATDDEALSDPKPGAQAYGLPLARLTDASDGRVRLAGQVRPATAATTVTLERRVDGRWRTVSTFATHEDGTFVVSVDTHGHSATLRAAWTAPAGERLSGVPLTIP